MDKTQILIGSENLNIWRPVSDFLESKGLSLTRVHSVKQACETLAHEDILLAFCENRLEDGTYEDLLMAARELRAAARIVVVPPGSEGSDGSTYVRAKELGAFDVLRESYGVKDVEWLLICAMRDAKSARTLALGKT
jgi:DNA-binding NtrC family response regulator